MQMFSKLLQDAGNSHRSNTYSDPVCFHTSCTSQQYSLVDFLFCCWRIAKFILLYSFCAVSMLSEVFQSHFLQYSGDVMQFLSFCDSIPRAWCSPYIPVSVTADNRWFYERLPIVIMLLPPLLLIWNSPERGWKWKWSNGVVKNEMDLFWCIFKVCPS